MTLAKHTKKFTKNREVESELEVLRGIGGGIAFGNEFPKSRFKTAHWQLVVVFLCFRFTLQFSYPYAS